MREKVNETRKTQLKNSKECKHIFTSKKQRRTHLLIHFKSMYKTRPLIYENSKKHLNENLILYCLTIGKFVYRQPDQKAAQTIVVDL